MLMPRRAVVAWHPLGHLRLQHTRIIGRAHDDREPEVVGRRFLGDAAAHASDVGTGVLTFNLVHPERARGLQSSAREGICPKPGQPLVI
jgi:hypothetical protein